MQAQKGYWRLIALSLSLSALLSAVTGCVSVHSLDRYDRIPHEARKGYVKFSSEFEADVRERFICVWDPTKPEKYYSNCIGIEIDKTEHGYPVKITGIPRMPLAGHRAPISERPGVHTYVIRYPSLVAVRINQGLSGKTAAQQVALRQVEPGTPLDERILAAEEMYSDVWITLWTSSEKEAEIEIRENLVTPVGVNCVFTFEKEKKLGKHTVMIYRGALKSVRTGDFLVIPIIEEDMKNRTGTRAYDADRQRVFAQAIEAAKALGWVVKSSFVDESASSFDVEINRFPANNMAFTIGVYRTPEGKNGVDLSSTTWWQGWGSFNTNLSREKINEFYAKLDQLLSVQ